ncbi:MAG: phosphoglycerate kinase [Candidatus Aminicenantes bacterium]|nr:phosphoglycerate kinase [Candidatus Aminicenantes bacterium]
MLTLTDLDLKGKRVFLRVDFNVPLDEGGKIRDDTRIKAALPTLNYLLEHKATVIIASHFGRPKGKPDPKFSLQPVASALREFISHEVLLAPGVTGDTVDKMKTELRPNQVLLLENLRFDPGETANDPEFARSLAKGIDYYVNDAFGACHRKHASVVGITQYVQKKAAGFLISKEIEYLEKLTKNPGKPYVAVLGGAKVSDKIPVIENLLNKADHILIGGAMAYTFFAAQGKGVGRSLVEEEIKETALDILSQTKERGLDLHLPLDHILAEKIDPEVSSQTIDEFPFPDNMMALDIGPKTAKEYSEILKQAKTIFWNGPMGVFEIDKFSQGTLKIAQAVADSDALSVIGGGDSVAAIDKAGVSDKISHISTGGGASLEFIANETLPGIEALAGE